MPCPMTPPPLLIGLDCAAAAVRMGCACARLCDGRLEFLHLATAAHWDGIDQQITAWLTQESAGPALLCLDAPLGWPRPLGEALAGHQAGQGLPLAADRLFSRITDRDIAHRLGKRPMEVGANTIARVALAAVNLLDRLRAVTAQHIPLAWAPGPMDETAAIEVYPAAALACRGLLRPGYKKTAADRAAMLAALEPQLPLAPQWQDACRRSEHLLDACLCCLAGSDFLQGLAPAPPPELWPVVRQEGWIWARDLPA